MTCREFIDFLWQYVSEELSPPQRKAFDDHLAACPECVAYLHNYQTTIQLSAAAFPASDDPLPSAVPESLVQAILAARKVMD